MNSIQMLSPSPYLDALSANITSLSECKRQLQAHQQMLDQAFRQGADVKLLIQARATFIDGFLKILWDSFSWDQSQRIGVIAVGGYGRGELHPHSDLSLIHI